MKKVYKNFTFDLIVALTALVVGIVMLPPFGLGQYALNAMLAGALIVYFFVYLFDKLKRTKGSIFILTASESVIYFFVIVDLILEQIHLYDVLSVCRALGIVLFVRGTASAIGMYIRATTSRYKNTNLPSFIFRIFLIVAGVYLFANPLITNLVFNWAICILFFISALCFGGLAVLFAPTRKNTEG